MRTPLFLLLLLAFFGAAAAAEPARHGAGSPLSYEIEKTARGFWLALNLGDMEHVRTLVRQEDNASVPVPEGEGAEIMKMKDLPAVKPLREELKNAARDSFILKPPKLAADNSTATVEISIAKDKIRKFFELRAVQDAYLTEAYAATKEHRPQPELAAVKKSVLEDPSRHRTAIENRLELIAQEKLPDLFLERTPRGWRVNLQKVLEQSQP